MKIRNINEKYGDCVDFESLEEMEGAIKKSGYKIPDDGLKIGRDYEEIFCKNDDILVHGSTTGKFLRYVYPTGIEYTYTDENGIEYNGQCEETDVEAL